MEADNKSEIFAGVKSEKERNSLNQSNKKSFTRVEKKSVRVCKSSTSHVVEEVSRERSDCTRTSQSCNQQNSGTHKIVGTTGELVKGRDDHWEECGLQDTEDTINEALSIREHLENINANNVSDFWDQVFQ